MLAFVVGSSVAGGVFFLASLVAALLRGAFAEYQARYLTTSLRELSDMFLFLEPRQLVVLNVAAMVALAVLGSWLGGPLLCAGAGALGFFAPAVAVRLYRRRRRALFDAQLSDALQQMANALRAGLTFQQALEQVGRESPPPLGQEFG
ncbi:MAG TPA: secretion system protein F, partial [Myxococcales bacterium]|nr:secretion system protein F [Myxococcales bacterium]